MNKKPLNCEEAERLIPLYVAGLLDDPAPLEAHLKTCRACREKVERERFIEDTLRTLKPYQPPPGLKEDILKAVKRPHGFSRLVRQPLFWTFIGTATVILILAALFLACFLAGCDEASHHRVIIVKKCNQGIGASQLYR